jgi:hypothetical protein
MGWTTQELRESRQPLFRSNLIGLQSLKRGLTEITDSRTVR